MTHLKISLPTPSFIPFDRMTLKELSETFNESMTIEVIKLQIEAERKEVSQLNFLPEKLSFEEFRKVAKYVSVVDDEGKSHHPDFIVSLVLFGDLRFSMNYHDEELTFLKMAIQHENFFNQSGMSNILIGNIIVPEIYKKIHRNTIVHRLAMEDLFQKPLSEYEKVVDFMDANPDHPDFCFDLIYERYFLSLADSQVSEDYEPILREIYCRSVILGEKSMIQQIRERGVVSFIRKGRLCEYYPPYIILRSSSINEEIRDFFNINIERFR